MMELPAGGTPTNTKSEWLYPCPVCGKLKYYLNPYVRKGHCKSGSCGVVHGSKRTLYKAFDLEYMENDEDFGLHINKISKQKSQSLSYLTPAWDHPQSRKYLMSRNIREDNVVLGKILFNETSGNLVAHIKSVTKCYRQTQQIFRSIRYTSKWMPLTEGLSLSNYIYSQVSDSSDKVILMEGIFDVVTTGLFSIAIAILGTDLSLNQVEYLRRRYKTIMLWLDYDEGGFKATEKYGAQLQSLGIEVLVCTETRDPKEVSPYKKQNKGILQDLLLGEFSKYSIPYKEWLFYKRMSVRKEPSYAFQ